jgi:hypothetical protein
MLSAKKVAQRRRDASTKKAREKSAKSFCLIHRCLPLITRTAWPSGSSVVPNPARQTSACTIGSRTADKVYLLAEFAPGHRRTNVV